jgi:hypothetical protein
VQITEITSKQPFSVLEESGDRFSVDLGLDRAMVSVNDSSLTGGDRQLADRD